MLVSVAILQERVVHRTPKKADSSINTGAHFWVIF